MLAEGDGRCSIDLQATRANGQPVQRTGHRDGRAVHHVRIDHGRLQSCVAEQYLYLANVVATLQDVRGEAVSKRMTRECKELVEVATPDLARQSIEWVKCSTCAGSGHGERLVHFYDNDSPAAPVETGSDG